MKKIEVKLIDCTGYNYNMAGFGPEHFAKQKLAYTKATRLELGKETQDKILAMDYDELDKEIDYISKTIPSSWEFIDYTFEILNVTRAFTHQFVRTRQGSYAQQTMRMLDMKGFSYMVPETIKNDKYASVTYASIMNAIQMTYDNLIKLGIPAEDARGILPTNIHTNIIAKFNLRTLAEMAKSRTGGRTQNEYAKVFNTMCDAVLEVHPFAAKFLFPDDRENWEIVDDALKGNVEAMKAFDKLKRDRYENQSNNS